MLDAFLINKVPDGPEAKIKKEDQVKVIGCPETNNNLGEVSQLAECVDTRVKVEGDPRQISKEEATTRETPKVPESYSNVLKSNVKQPLPEKRDKQKEVKREKSNEPNKDKDKDKGREAKKEEEEAKNQKDEAKNEKELKEVKKVDKE